MIGAFAAAGVIIGIGKTYITETLHGGNAGWGLVFVAIFIGLAAGMFLGSRMLEGLQPPAAVRAVHRGRRDTARADGADTEPGHPYRAGRRPRRRWPASRTRPATPSSGSRSTTACAGRTFAFLQSAIQIILLAVVAGRCSCRRESRPRSTARPDRAACGSADVVFSNVGDNVLLLLAAAVAVLLGVVSYRRMDDRRGIPLVADLLAAIRGEQIDLGEPKRPRGLLIALEGGEGAGKTTQARLLGIWLRDQGYEVVVTHEPGATKVGMRLRALLLDKSQAGLSARAEALMYAADRAEHVASVIRPALDRGAIVITDRYVDSSLAYQGAGRQLPVEEVERLNRWATGGMTPDLTILLDLPPAAGLSRHAPSADRLESEPIAFHERVRQGFRALAAAEPRRYLVADAALPPEEISRRIQERIQGNPARPRAGRG